ncbi:hypothetical protein ATK86_7047 [Nocardia fluminea]|uniref:Uncharacterized protein n=1 Tax=Nocardia fluminea TaxID=134984 RepID=A0A2N3VLQ0_9NOCA|nr:hypothetical protein ATK86_7047 [Nocardia fluminea]
MTRKNNGRKPGTGKTNSTPRAMFEEQIPDAEIEIRVVDGAEGETLALLQARVLWEVTRWQMGQNNSANGQQEAA